jgi:hypothetical protein
VLLKITMVLIAKKVNRNNGKYEGEGKKNSRIGNEMEYNRKETLKETKSEKEERKTGW